MQPFRRTILILFFIVFSPMIINAQEDMIAADQLFDQGGLSNFQQAADLYTQVVATDPDHYEANWKSARALREYGDEAQKQAVEGWKRICAEYGQRGMQYAQKAIALEPERPDGHYYYGLSVGIYSDGVSIFTALKEGLKDKTQQSFEKAYDLDKQYNNAGPILSLGRFWAVLPWPLKDKKKSLAYYREYQATSHFADNTEARIFLAELLLQMGGKKNKAEAKTYLEKAVQSTDQYLKDWAERLLTKAK